MAGGSFSLPLVMKRTLVVLLIACLAVAGAVVSALRIAAVPPIPTLSVVPGQLGAVPGPPPTIPLPRLGSYALSTDRDGMLASQDLTAVHPIASMAKTLTALVVLDAHPLAIDAAGPEITVTPADVDVLKTVIAEGGTFAPVQAGESLSERQLLLGMMLPSANNFAVMLANWVGGSQTGFLVALNAKAAALGMAHTHFADPDGLSADTVSTAQDLIVLGTAAVESPTLAAITGTQSATLPDGTVITNIDTLVGTQPGWIGIKTGHTDAAGYCLLFAARRSLSPAAPPLVIVGVVLGQATRQDTFTAATAGVDAATKGYTVIDLAPLRPSVGGQVSAPWGATSTLQLSASTSSTPQLMRLGSAISVTVEPQALTSATVAGGTQVAVIRAAGNGQTIATWKVQTTTAITPPGWWWRLWHD